VGKHVDSRAAALVLSSGHGAIIDDTLDFSTLGGDDSDNESISIGDVDEDRIFTCGFQISNEQEEIDTALERGATHMVLSFSTVQSRKF
jgi:hypothetical protein